MARYALTYTLFPYTTLFRSPSVGPGCVLQMCDAGHHHRREHPACRARPLRVFLRAEERLPNAMENSQRSRSARGIDRKSTRLNSSHVEISYAVFCLKKKNKH